MAERQDPPDNPAAESLETQTQDHIQKGMGLGARELASIGESGEKNTLEQDADSDADSTDPTVVAGPSGRSSSVLDDDDEEQLTPQSKA